MSRQGRLSRFQFCAYIVMGNIKKRLFIVGCSRSGTTVLQVSVASHPRIKSFPETFFFRNLSSRYIKYLPKKLVHIPLRFGLAIGQERRAFQRALREIGRPGLEHKFPSDSWRLKPYVDTYLDILDTETAAEGKDIWVEKTPAHIFRLDLILQYVPSAYVIHMLRDGRDVVASIVDRAQKYEKKFDNQKDPEYGINRWNKSIRISKKYLGLRNHIFVRYEEFVSDTRSVMEKVCNKIDINYSQIMEEGSDEVAEEVIPEQRGWIKNAKNSPKEKESKFEKIFSKEERKDIEEKLEMEEYKRIKNKI